eukprot:gene44789-45116_t
MPQRPPAAAAPYATCVQGATVCVLPVGADGALSPCPS